jgi:hypothetical protein
MPQRDDGPHSRGSPVQIDEHVDVAKGLVNHHVTNAHDGANPRGRGGPFLPADAPWTVIMARTMAGMG